MKRPWYKSYPAGVSPAVDYKELKVSDALARSAAEFSDKTALIFLGARMSFKKLDELTNRFARALIDMGVKKGDRVAMLMPNMPQIVIASHAAWRIGAVVVMNNPLYTDVELEHQLVDSGASVLVTLDLLAPRMIALKPKTSVQTIIVTHIRDYLAFPKKQLLPILAKDKHRTILPQPGVHEWVGLLGGYLPTDPGISVDFDDMACLQYTGGTTGVSKGAVHTHRNLSSNIQQLSAALHMLERGKLTVLGTIPFFHVFGLTCAMNYALWQGWTNVLLPRPDPLAMLQAIDTYKVNVFAAVPTLYIGMLNHPHIGKYDLSSLIACSSGAGPLPMEVLQQFTSRTGKELLEGYGLTESTAVVSINPFGGVTKPGTIGIPLPGVEVKVVDVDTGNTDMPIGEIGEIVVRGPNVMKGYYNRPEETAGAIRDGWLYTGDIGSMDGEGYLTIIDRKKDMIIAGGYNIYPRDIDEVLFEHPKILEACAIGVPDAYRGETVKAFVVVRPGETLMAGEVIEYCKTRLAAYKVPKIIEFIDTLPKSLVGKILRKELRRMELERQK
ncbi:MAG: long-chain fatty acid--CoA ligase [Spirochaetes bacterium]|nr:long-chain fatty acid--CoA ligase [Spirochaetota bacterium]